MGGETPPIRTSPERRRNVAVDIQDFLTALRKQGVFRRVGELSSAFFFGGEKMKGWNEGEFKVGARCWCWGMTYMIRTM